MRHTKEDGWIGCDFDGTLIRHGGWDNTTHDLLQAHPIKPMIERVRTWLAEGYEVKIFTANAGNAKREHYIINWCVENLGQQLEITNAKDHRVLELWDDHNVAVEEDTGRILGGAGRWVKSVQRLLF